MTILTRLPALATGLALSGALAASAQPTPATLTVQVNKPGAAVNKNMYGLFFEDINFAADGGLYPELVKNKSFETDAVSSVGKRCKVQLISTRTRCATSRASRLAIRTTCA